MTLAAHHDEPRARALDRLCELASVGAGHACGALAALLGRPFVMDVPEAHDLAAERPDAPFAARLGADERDWCGVLFGVSGGPGGALGLFFAPAARAALLEALVGRRAEAGALAESALCEVGNIVASHALSALGELLGARVLPSPPRYAPQDAPREFAQLACERAGGPPALRIEVELSDRAGELRALLVWVPRDPR
jgi:chemotaxis protein CheY-P-specific phosphatase CheC